MKRVIVVGLLTVSLIFTAWTASSGGQVKGAIQIKSISMRSSSIKIEVVIKNTGDVRHRFPVGCSLQRTNRSWFDLPYQVYTLSPGKTGSLVFEGENISIRSFYLVRVAIWYGERSDGRLKNRLDMDEKKLR